MRFNEDGVLHYSDEDIQGLSRDCKGYSAYDNRYTAAKDWVTKQKEKEWTPLKRGQKFILGGTDGPYLLAESDEMNLVLVGPLGDRWSSASHVTNFDTVTKEEWKRLARDYHDNFKLVGDD